MQYKLHHRCSTELYIDLWKYWDFQREAKVEQIIAIVTTHSVSCLKKESKVSLNKKVVFVFHTIFRLNIIKQIIYCIIYKCLFSLFVLFFFISFSKKRDIETMLSLPYSYNWRKVQQQNEWRKKPGISEIWFLHHLKNLNMLQSDKSFSQQPQKILAIHKFLWQLLKTAI